MARIKGITQDPEVGAIYKGKVVKLMEFGAFVNFFGAKDGLVHVSQISSAGRIGHPNEVLKEGQEVWVKLLGLDDRGKVRLSMKIIDQATGAEIPRAEGEPDPMEDRGPPRRREGGGGDRGGERRGPRPPRRD
jgi:polyribonucleotide nucleotidyltransferase